jgi:predicted flap endonuclease-1-like 5' DNA nuclease
MSYLVVKIVLLLALAALCGAAGLLVARRRFIEVTDEYERFIRASAGQGAATEQAWRTVEERLSRLARLSRGAPTGSRAVPAEARQIESRIASLGRSRASIDAASSLLRSPTRTRAPPATLPHNGNGRNLLEGASFGPPDELKRTRGIGPVLDRLLHRLGVFYFWQIAEWTEDDVAFVDDRLDVFKGRIARDAWVSQAARLAHEPDTAKPPPSRSPGAATHDHYSAFAP